MRSQASLFTSLLILVPVFSAPASLDAVVFNVSKLTDSNDGLCDADCSLREAVDAANTTFGADTIVLPAGTLTLTIPGRGENSAATGDLDIIEDVEIRGQGAEVTLIDGGNLDRVFDVFPGSVEISDLTIHTGRAEDDDFGGGLANNGTLTLRDVVIRNNTVAGDGGGGGIFNSATLLIENSTIRNNSVTDGDGGGIENASDLELVASTISGNQVTGFFGNGGGLANTSTATLRNSTISGNSTGGMSGDGGGIHSSSELTLLNCTVHANSAADDGDAIAGTGLSQTFTNTVISGDCDVNTANMSMGGNLESPGNTCGFGGGGDQTNVSTGALALGPLADNGGPTRTHALNAGSAAIDSALNGPCPALDQRARSRPIDGDDNGSQVCDVGAYELGGVSEEIFADGFESGDTSAW